MAINIEKTYQDYVIFCKHLGVQPMPQIEWANYSISLVEKHDGGNRCLKKQQWRTRNIR
jgi:hypothetical protein